MSIFEKMGLDVAELKQKISSARVLVLGDVMLDRYWFGDSTRISPEAPVPIAKIERIEERAGGAANVARNIAALGGQSTLLSIVGDDEAADALERLLTAHGVQTLLKRDASISTTIKLRVVARQQQLIRLDFEDLPSNEVLQDKLTEFERLITQHDLVILSDYGKGSLIQVDEMIALAHKHHIPVLIDPKGDDYRKYQGASLLTPNRSEFRQVAGRWYSDDELQTKAQALRAKLNLDALLVTRSEEGMTLFKSDGSMVNQPTLAREVYDVSGAGDTVIATLGLARAAGLSYEQAMWMANAAAGIVVAKLGTAVCSQEELFAL